jgi:hypothetical protein
MSARFNTHFTRIARLNTAGRGMRTSLGCRVTRIQVAHKETELARELAADEPIMAAATNAERRVFTSFKWSIVALLAMFAITLLFPAAVLLCLVVLPVAAIYGSQWKTTRARIAHRVERSRRHAELMHRDRPAVH